MSVSKLFLLSILAVLRIDQINGLPGLYLSQPNGNVRIHKFGYGYKPTEALNIDKTVPEERGTVPVSEPAQIIKRNVPNYLPSAYVQSQMAYPQTEYVQPTGMYGMQGQVYAAPISQVTPEFQHVQYPHINPGFPPTPYSSQNLGYPEISGQTIYTDYLKIAPEYVGLERLYPGIYLHRHPNVQIRPAFGYPNSIYLPSKIPTPQGEIDVELVDVQPYRPGTEPLGQVPMVKSIEVIKISNGKYEKNREAMDEDNELE